MPKSNSQPKFVGHSDLFPNLHPLPLWSLSLLMAMAILLIARILFLLTNPTDFHTAPGRELVHAFLLGFRFDLSTALITITLPLLPLWIPLPATARRWMATISAILFAIIIITMATILGADLVYYGESNCHLTTEVRTLLLDVRSMTNEIVKDFHWQLLLMFALWGGMIWLVRRIFALARPAETLTTGWGWKRLLIFLPVAIFTLVGIRGGIQKEPLKSADAVFSNNNFVSNVAMNGWYSYITESTKPSRSYKLLPDSDAIATVRSMVAREGDTFVDPKFPMLRTGRCDGAIVKDGEKLNVVLIVVESLNAEYLQTFGGKESVMPFLDSLSRQSVAFINCQSVGTRSFRGLCGVLASYPNLNADSYHLTFLLPQLDGLGKAFDSYGYHTRFLHGAPLNSMGVTAIARMSGYEEFVSGGDFPNADFNGSWGVWDHIALNRVSHDMDTMGEPFHYGMFTLCTHSPWTLPKDNVPRFPKEHPRAEILNTYSYLDDSFRSFFLRESTRDRFTHTLYVIIGDHTTHASNDVERFHIGCIFYAPGRLTPRVDSTLCSQLDIFPSILDLAGLNAPHASFGASLFAKSKRPEWSVMLQSDLLYWRQGSRMLASNPDRDALLVDPRDPDPNPRDYLSVEPNVVAEYHHRLAAIYQLAETLARENRLFPATNPSPLPIHDSPPVAVF